MAVKYGKSKVAMQTSYKGMWKDSLESLSPEGTVRDARNAIHETDEANSFGLAAEPATELCAKLPEGSTPRGRHYVEERDWHLFILDNGEIGYVDGKKCEYVCLYAGACDLGQDSKEYIPIVSKVMQPGNDLIIYWAANDTYYRMNVDETKKCQPEDCDEFKLFRCSSLPAPRTVKQESGGYDLPVSAVRIFAQLEDKDGNKTNWFNSGPTVHLGSENNRNGDVSEESILVQIDNFQDDYEYINIAAMHRVGGGLETYQIAKEPAKVGTISFIYRSTTQRIRDIALTEIFDRKLGYIKGKDLVSYNNRLFLYNTYGEPNPDLQRKVNEIKTTLQIRRVPMRYSHLFSGLRHGEVYNVSISYNGCDGRSTRAFHIPFNPGSPSTGAEVTDPGVDDGGVTRGETNYDRFEPNQTGAIDPDEVTHMDPSAIPSPQPYEDEDECECTQFSDISRRVFGVRQGLNMSDLEDYLINLILTATKTPLDTVDPIPSVLGGDRGIDIWGAYELLKELRCCRLKEEANAGGNLTGDGNVGDQSAEEQTTYNSFDIDFLVNNFDFSAADAEAELQSNGLTRDDSGTSYFEYRSEVYTSGSDGDTEGIIDFRGDPDPNPGTGTRNPGGPNMSFYSPSLEDECPDFDDCPQDPTEGGPAPPGATGTSGDSSNTSSSRNYTGTSGESFTGTREEVEITDCEPQIIYFDEECTRVKEIIPCIDYEGVPELFESCETYPEDKLCCRDGEEGYVYGDLAGKPIKFPKMPEISEQPHFISFGYGVPSAYFPDNDELANTYARFLHLKFDDVPVPTEEELGFPLNPENPWTINLALRDGSNRTVHSSGLMLPTFLGEIRGRQYTFPTHVASSSVHVNRHIDAGGSHRGSANGGPQYTYHSPDIEFLKPPMNAEIARKDLDLKGGGFQHGLYEEDPLPQKFSVPRYHRKGARTSVYLNRWSSVGVERGVKGMARAPFNKALAKEDDFTIPFANFNGQSCTYLETDTPLGTATYDDSFDGTLEVHKKTVSAAGSYTTLKIPNPAPYGRLENTVYYPYYEATREDFNERVAYLRSGDSFINLYSFKKTSYVSDKVGEDITPPIETDEGFVVEKWPFSVILKAIFKTVGGEDCGTVPIEGNTDDPRNNTEQHGITTDSDRYYPQSCNGLVTGVVESDVNLGYRGSGDSEETSTYRDLNGQVIDSTFPGGSYENGWLNRYYAHLEEISTLMKTVRAILNFLFTYVIGFWIIIEGLVHLVEATGNGIAGLVFSVGTIPAVIMAAVFVAVGISWIVFWANTDSDNKFIDKYVLGLKDCNPDYKEDGHFKMNDNRVRGLEDNYIEYNSDFSETGGVDPVLGLPAGYNTCDHLTELTLNIYYSNAQNPSSWTDAWRNFNVNNFTEIRADKGSISKMYEYKGRLYVHTTDTIYDLRSEVNTLKTSGGDVQIIASDLLQKPIDLFSGPEEGSFGLLDPNALCVTNWGVIFPGRESRDVYIFNGQTCQALGNQGLRNFFNENLYFDTLEQDPHFEGVDEKNGVGYSIGVDHRHNRLLITKNDPLNSFTLSYDPVGKRWVSFHDYQPEIYSWDRQFMFSVSDGALWKHHSRDKFLTFYGKKYDFKLDVPLIDRDTMDSFEWIHSVLDTEAYSYLDGSYVRNHQVTFDKVALYNSYQCSGLKNFLNSELLDTTSRSIRNRDFVQLDFIHRTWRFNEIFDHLVDYNSPFLTPDNGEYPEIIEGHIQEGIKTQEFYDNYVIVRLVYSKYDDKRLIFKNIKSLTELKGE